MNLAILLIAVILVAVQCRELFLKMINLNAIYVVGVQISLKLLLFFIKINGT